LKATQTQEIEIVSVICCVMLKLGYCVAQRAENWKICFLCRNDKV